MIYTKTGDTGETSLLGGKRVSKSCIEMHAIGEVDELNAALGMTVSRLQHMSKPNLAEKLISVQHKLFTIGSMLAAVQTDILHIPKLTPDDVRLVEKWIDHLQEAVEPLSQFILPGGHEVAAELFWARALCRRAERHVVQLAQRYEDFDPLAQKYLNRLSDFLFVFARWINMKFGIEEVKWKKDT